jgi:hypothetical protein
MHDPLDKLLREWSERTAPTQDELRRLQEYVCRVATAPARPLPHRAATPSSAFWPALMHASLGAAVVLLAGGLYLSATAPQQLGGTAMSVPVGIPAERIERSRILYDSVEGLFTDRLKWIAESNGDVGLGVDNVHAALNAAAAPLLVRLTVVSRRRGESAWQRVWGTDIITRPEEVANVVPDHRPTGELSLWVYPLEDGKLAVNTSLTLESPLRLSANAEEVVAPGVPSRLAALREGDMEYELYQTVVSL